MSRRSEGFLEHAASLRAQGVGWSDLPGDALPFVLAGVLEAERCLVVVDEDDAADRVLRGLRFFLDDPSRAELFPADDVRPYDGFSPSPDLPAQRLRVLHRLDRGDPLIVVAPVRALLQRVPDADTRARGTLVVAAGDTVERDDLVRALTATGYLAAPRAEHPGVYAVRGDVVDVWSVGLPSPVRIDLFDDEVEEVRRLDPKRLVPVKKAKRALVLPGREERLDDEAVRRFQQEMGRHVAAQRRGVKLRRRLVEELRAGIRFSAVEDYLPALVPTEAALDALGGLPVIAVHPQGLAASARDVWDTARRRWSELDDEERPLVPPEERLVPPDEVLARLADAHPVYEMAGTDRARSLGAHAVEGLAVHGADLSPVVAKLRKLLDRDVRLALVAASAKRAEMLHELLEGHGLTLVGRSRPLDAQPGQASVLVGDLPRGFVAEGSGWAFVPATALFGGGNARARKRAHDLFDVGLSSITDLKQGDHVVHRLHGIGRYEGLVRLDLDGSEQDFVKLIYRGDDLLYVPATSLGQLSRYTASSPSATVRLDKLGGATWARRKGKVRDSLLAMAQEMMTLHAKRELTERAPYPPPGELYKQFVQRFPYVETPDQAQAILDVADDLAADEPMDRLVCGDVGFGKTEVAMRAAMRAIEAGRQVSVLCPTTVLAFQHLRTFRERFADLPITVGMLSRFTTAAVERELKAGLAKGSVDVVVGTHGLLGRGVRFKDLGLVVIDEEHRFGVKQKARLKKMRTEVDVLAMSATPIPRTLQMALQGLREMSIMATPPEERLSVRTSVARFTRARVRDAVLLEMERGGQVYFVHNRIESLQAMKERLEGWIPEARIRMAHGKMKGEDIERVLIDFMEGRFDVLLSTAIVESGIDLPNVNTMLVHRADLFGLAQLYQLRGRVGRSSVRGNCILLTPEQMTRDARRRLQVLVENTRIGSGFAIAAADLEMRGGGNLLGDAQSGNIDAVGYNTWVELLEEAVHSARGEADLARIDPELQVPVAAFLPESLLPDMNERLGWYRRFSAIDHPEDAERLLDELEGEFGDLPREVHALASRVACTLICRRLGIPHVAWGRVRVVLELHPTSPLTDAVLAKLVEAQPKRFELTPERSDRPRTLAVRFTPKEAERPWRFLRWVFARLEQVVREQGGG